MKTVQLIRNVAAGYILVFGISQAGMVDAADQNVGRTDSQGPTSSEQARDSLALSSLDVLVRGGYNVGRVPVSDIPGCVGPVSFCNMYDGS